MIPTRLMTRAATLVTVVDSGTEDVYGNPTDEIETSTSVLCELQQIRRTEEDGTTSWQTGTYNLFLPAGTSVTGFDRIEIDGDSYELEGTPERVRNPRTGQVSHIEATVRRAE